MSSSSTTAQGSRSPSPLTPETSESPKSVVIQSDLDLTSWYLSMHPTKSVAPQWSSNPAVYMTPHKSEEEQMLRLDELIEQHAYDDSPSSGFNSIANYSSPPSYSTNASSPFSVSESTIPEFRSSELAVPARQGPLSLTKPIPPPAALPRKQDSSSAHQRVTHPPKESCFNLPIMFPSIPEGGTKSRVETQVRVTVDLADSSSSSDPYKYDRVGSWKWLKLPPGTATKKRTRKQGKIDPDPQDVLHLAATVTCASPPHNRVLSCTSCQTREAKRVAKKLAARVRPARSDTESDGEGRSSKSRQHEDTTSIIQFNCAETLDFSTGSVVLPLRITCYCRHHREKVGFNVHFSMMDHNGRVVGSGMSRPIMITDDHKTSNANKAPELIGSFTPVEHRNWPAMEGMLGDTTSSLDAGAPSRRKREFANDNNVKKRPKPYDASAKLNRISREGSVSSIPSPSTSYSPLPTTRASTPSSSLQNVVTTDSSGLPPPLQWGVPGSETSSPDSLATPLDNNSDVPMSGPNFIASAVPQELPLPPSIMARPAPTSIVEPYTAPHSMPVMFFDPHQAAQPMQVQLPTIHRLIPNAGPTHGGIEVTVLGANFHPTVQLNCVFGGVTASSTQRWSENTLVCILPPRATAGVVAVWFEGFPKCEDQLNVPLSLFTYSDESDRALMELALQVVGLKMTGKIEDAKNVAMRIVGNAGSDGSDPNNTTGMMHMASSPSTRDLRPLLFLRPGESDNFETQIVDLLSIIDTPMGSSAPNATATVDAISRPSPAGQTLLHFAAFLGFASLTCFLVKHDADLDARDRNGFTPLHLAALSQSSTCATILVEAGADPEIVNALGKTPAEVGVSGFFDNISPRQVEFDSDDDRSDDEDADFGDGEEDDDEFRQIISRRRSRRSLGMNSHAKNTPRRSANVSRATTPPPPPEADDNSDKKVANKDESGATDAKQAASFMEKMFQRTLAQLTASPGIIPNIPQLPLPHLPKVADLPAWNALPQIPMVFPVFVPMMPNWPSFLARDSAAVSTDGKTEGDEETRNMGAVALRAAAEWRSTWEKWVALAVATTAGQQIEEMPPPVYTPRAEEEGSAETAAPEKGHQEQQELAASTSASSRGHASDIRPVGYDDTPIPDQVVESFGYQPAAKRAQKLQKKHDRMLLLFWLPILFLSMLWAFHSGVHFAFQALKTALPVKTVLRT
ncbi:unnamed protein product [Cyclocybe aegerita]|uniref:IPT/TIG domain-containing protein n=1 Tax=Cyclocybe aegerita TaxID=1973307 RepID=A0A8S0XGI7_CYCAE|nr:unnamed protein product [Cyclocybe aegerita]